MLKKKRKVTKTPVNDFERKLIIAIFWQISGPAFTSIYPKMKEPNIIISGSYKDGKGN